MATEHAERPADEPEEGSAREPVAAYEPPAIAFLGRLKDLTAVGSFPDPT